MRIETGDARVDRMLRRSEDPTWALSTRGASIETLQRRTLYGGRKARSARRRLVRLWSAREP
jgi:hypothetical protein